MAERRRECRHLLARWSPSRLPIADGEFGQPVAKLECVECHAVLDERMGPPPHWGVLALNRGDRYTPYVGSPEWMF